MKKYRIVFTSAIQTFLQYRLNLALFLAGHIVILTSLYFLWLSVYESGGRLGDYTFTGIITYYVVVAYVRLTLNEGVSMGFQMVEDIKDGKIISYLLKPQSYLLTQLSDLLGRSLVNHIFVVPAVFALIAATDLWSMIPAVRDMAIFFMFSGLALIFYYVVYALAALSSLWVERGSHFIFGTIIVSSFLNGSLIPLDIFPNWFMRINDYLPFKFLMFNPIQAFLGRLHNLPRELFMAGIWIIALAGVLYFVWRRGIKRFESVGI